MGNKDLDISAMLLSKHHGYLYFLISTERDICAFRQPFFCRVECCQSTPRAGRKNITAPYGVVSKFRSNFRDTVNLQPLIVNSKSQVQKVFSTVVCSWRNFKSRRGMICQCATLYDISISWLRCKSSRPVSAGLSGTVVFFLIVKLTRKTMQLSLM